MENKSKNCSAIGTKVDQPSIEEQRKLKEENIIKNIRRWMRDHTNIIPLGEEDPAMDLLIAFIKSVKTEILLSNYGPKTFAAACIKLLSGPDTIIRTDEEELANYFNVGLKALFNLSHKLIIKFMDFVAKKTCLLFVRAPKAKTHQMRIFLLSTPIERIIATTHIITKREVSELIIVDEKGNRVSQVGPEDYFLVKDKRKKKNAKLYGYSPLPDAPLN